MYSIFPGPHGRYLRSRDARSPVRTASVVSALLAMITISAVAACHSSDDYPHQQLTLASGERVPIFGIRRLTLENETTALQLVYQTVLSLDDTAALRREVIGLWSAFAPYVEKAHVDAAVVTATAPPRGVGSDFAWLREYQYFGFLVKRRSDSRWYLQGDTAALPPAGAPGALTDVK